MEILNLLQGSAEWHAHRARHFNASEAPAMMGESPYETRAELIQRLATGITPEVDDRTQARFDDGHRCEAFARPLAEKIIGEELYPCVGTLGKYSASFDGLTMSEAQGFEHKRLNAALRAAMIEGCTGADLPMVYQIQMEHQCMVSTAERVLFMASEWDDAGNLVEERHCWYTPNPALRARIVAGWEMLEVDVAAYVPSEKPAVTTVRKEAGHLPIVFDMKVEGKLIACNIDAFKPAALAYINDINTTLKVDQDFADAIVDAKFCRDSADKLELSIEQALGQMGDINAALNTVREIAAAFDAKGLALEKLVTEESKRRKERMVTDAQAALREHIATLNKRQNRPYMPALQHSFTDFAGAIKGKRNMDSMQAAVDTLLRDAKIEANRIADAIDVNVKYLTSKTADPLHKALFSDVETIVLKAADDFQLLVDTRIAAFVKKQRDAVIQANLDSIAINPADFKGKSAQYIADTRADLENEEMTADQFGERVAEAKAAKQVALDALDVLHAAAVEAEKPAAPPPPAPAPTPAAAPIVAAAPVQQAAAPSPVSSAPAAFTGGNVVAMSRAPAPATAEPASLTLGAICARFGAGFTMTSAFVANTLGVQGTTVRASRMYSETDYQQILNALMTRMQSDEMRQAA